MGIEVDINVMLPNGTRIRERRKAPVSTRSGARRWAEAREHELLQRGLAPTPKKQVPLFEELADEFLNTYAASANKPSERRSKKSRFNGHLKPAFGKKRLDAISVRDIDGFKATKLAQGKAPKTINNYLTALRKCLSIAVGA